MAPNLSFVNIPDLNRVLRSEVFVSEDKQLRAVYLILDFKPLSVKFQDIDNAIRAGDPRLVRIDVSVPRFLAWKGIVQVELPSHYAPLEAAALRVKKASSHLSLEAEIDQFYHEEGREKQGELMIQVSDLGEELDKSLSVYASGFTVVRVANNLDEEEEEEMPLERKKGLRELLVGRAKGSMPKDTLGSQLPPALPPPPPSSANPFVPANLKKRKKGKEVAKVGEVVPLDEGVPPKLPKITKGKGRASLVESKEAELVAEVSLLNLARNPRLELDGATIPWNSSIREF